MVTDVSVSAVKSITGPNSFPEDTNREGVQRSATFQPILMRVGEKAQASGIHQWGPRAACVFTSIAVTTFRAQSFPDPHALADFCAPRESSSVTLPPPTQLTRSQRHAVHFPAKLVWVQECVDLSRVGTMSHGLDQVLTNGIVMQILLT